MRKNVAILLGSIALAFGGALSGCGSSDTDSEIVLQGNVDVRQVSLAFDGSGRVAKLLVEEGDVVKAGAVLAALDTESLRLQAEQASAQAELQKQNLRRLENGTRPEEITQARARLAAANAEATRAEDDYARLRTISANTGGRGASEQEVDHARKTAEAARARATEQAAALRLSQQGPRAEDKAAQRAQVRAAEAQTDLLQYQIDQGVLRAPVDGVIRARLVEIGDLASPQQPAFEIALADPKWIRVYVSEPDLGRIKPGTKASIVTDSNPDKTIAGRVGYISSVAEFTPKTVQTEDLRTSLVYEVRVLVDDKSNQLRLGQPVTVTLETAGTK